jgi:FlaA1/EpsC-like NDP-sugar epimerase
MASSEGELPGFRETGLARRLVLNRPVQIAIDIAVISLSFVSAYILRFDGLPPHDILRQVILLLPYIVILFLASNYAFGVHRFMWRYTSLHEAKVLSSSVVTAQLILTIIWAAFMADHRLLRIPIGVMLAHPVLTYFGLLGVRGLRRVQFNRTRQRHNREEEALVSAARAASSSRYQPMRANGRNGTKRVLLIGAGTAGQMLIRELQENRQVQIVGFLDDDPLKQKRMLGAYPILGTTDDLFEVYRTARVDEVVLCMPSAPRSVLRKIAAMSERRPIKLLSVPSLTEILEERVEISRFRPVKMEDLLGRAAVEHPADDQNLAAAYQRKRILVTGAAGSIGSELARQLAFFEPSHLALLDKDENGLYEIGLELREDHPRLKVCEVMANVRDRDRLEQVFRELKPEVVFHAAAYKHVPMMEAHPSEAILNNVIGTKNLVETAAAHGLERFVMISTDKAVNPTSVMGASKRVAEMVVRDQALLNGNGHPPGTPAPRYCCVRFGNVLGSRASVVPLFRKRIEQGKNIQVTHPDIERFFMTIPEAVQLVIKAGSLGRCGETFVLDMGDPVRIVDLARELIEQSGLIPGEDIKIEFTGLRPGEKLYEEVLVDEEQGARSTDYPKIFVGAPLLHDAEDIRAAVANLESAARAHNDASIYGIFHDLDIGYQGEWSI